MQLTATYKQLSINLASVTKYYEVGGMPIKETAANHRRANDNYRVSRNWGSLYKSHKNGKGYEMKFIDWFAGVGGFRRGMELAGHECVGFCEFDKYAVMSYTAMHLCTPEQLEYLSTLPLKERQKEILKDEYRNGEWYANDVRSVDARNIPESDCWCFGFPCQDISVAGKQLGFTGNRSSLFFRVMYLVGQLEEEKRPTYLFIENVKNLLSVNGGWDFARLLIEMDRGGYDAEWQVLNSKYFGVPQNRERCFIIGHLRGRSTAEVFPVEGTNGADYIHGVGHRKGYRRNMQVFDPVGITETLDTCTGGGRGHHTIEEIGIDVIAHTRPPKKNFGEDRERVLSQEGLCVTLRSTDYKDPTKVAVPALDIQTNRLYNNRGTIHDVDGISRTIIGAHQKRTMVGYNATLKHGGGHDANGACIECQRLQRIVGEQSDDDGSGNVDWRR